MAQIPDEVLLDVRLIERHIRQGIITREEYDKRVAQLKDIATEGDVIDLEHLRGDRGNAGAQPS